MRPISIIALAVMLWLTSPAVAQDQPPTIEVPAGPTATPITPVAQPTGTPTNTPTATRTPTGIPPTPMSGDAGYTGQYATPLPNQQQGPTVRNNWPGINLPVLSSPTAITSGNVNQDALGAAEGIATEVDAFSTQMALMDSVFSLTPTPFVVPDNVVELTEEEQTDALTGFFSLIKSLVWDGYFGELSYMVRIFMLWVFFKFGNVLITWLRQIMVSVIGIASNVISFIARIIDGLPFV